MAQEIFLSGVRTIQHGQKLRASLIERRPHVIGVAAAFVSVEGVKYLIETLRRCGQPECRLVAGTDNAITHPAALYQARDQGWRVRLGKARAGIFHPKMVVAGQRFTRVGAVQNLCCVYVGSANLTRGGLTNNVECGLLADAESCLTSASTAFAELWNSAANASDSELRNYAARFAECARRRTVSQLRELGINDSRDSATETGVIPMQERSLPVIGADFAIAAWAGLQSFTGEYRFQVEFPRDAGKVISQLIGGNAHADGGIDVYCPSDEQTRGMQYKFYADNGMFRLNIPNDVPGVTWAREHKDGIAIVEKGPTGGAPLRIRLLQPGVESREIVSRSSLLGTWGRTPTRTYGWY